MATNAPGEINALLGRGTVYRGKLTFEGRVRIDGKFEGEVFSPGTLVVGEGAEIRGRLDVGTLLVLGGELWGAVIARQLVEIHAAAIVHADIETPQVFVDRGAVFDGRCTMGDGPSERHDVEQLLEDLGTDDGVSEPSDAEESSVSEGDSAELVPSESEVRESTAETPAGDEEE